MNRSDNQLYPITESSPDAIFIGVRGRFAYVNPAALRLFGAVCVDQLLGRPVAERIHPDYRAVVAARIRDLDEHGGREPLLEEKYLRLDGTPVDVEVSAAPFRYQGEDGAVIFVRDITARKRAEAQFFATRQMLELVLDHIPQRVFWKDRDSRFLGANRATLTDVGLDFRHEIVGKSDWDLPTRIHAELYYRDDQRVMDEDAPKLNYEEPLVLPDGRQRWLLTSKVPMHDDPGKVIGILCTYTDISEQKATQSRLGETLHQLKAIVDNAQVGIAFLMNRRLAWINPALERMFGYALDDVKGKTIAPRYADPSAFERLGAEAYPVLAAGQVYEAEVQMRRKDGGTFWVQMRGSAVDAADMRKGSIWILLDIDAQKRAIAQLQELNATLAKRVEEETAKSLQKEHLMIDQARHAAMGEMIGNIAHQWRQPLSTLGLVIQNLRYDFTAGRLGAAELDDYVAKALRAIGQMSTTIDDFRDFFKPSRHPEAFSPVDAIHGCLDLVGASLKACNIDLAVSGPRAFELFGYPGEFSQIILNLIANAKDALVERRIAPGRIDITVAPAAQGVAVVVRDNAGGIDGGHLEKIFDPYFTTKEKGTGIGLYMARTIVEQHMHGSIRAENTTDGARLTMNLPLDLTENGMP